VKETSEYVTTSPWLKWHNGWVLGPGSWEGVVALWEGVVAQGKVWWLNGNTSDCSPAVPGSNPVPPQPTADCQSSGGLPPRMALG
jgi:hypothetical protein